MGASLSASLRGVLIRILSGVPAVLAATGASYANVAPPPYPAGLNPVMLRLVALITLAGLIIVAFGLVRGRRALILSGAVMLIVATFTVACSRL
ncbi:hypothetical protein ACVME8_007054 [Bradyrhizobium diazoefficiens]